MEEINVPIEKDWLSAGDIATYMGVSTHVVTAMLRGGDLPAVKFGREWRVARSDLENYLNEARRMVWS
ncbi:MAG: helix-turn-helix domain-containing protein [Actinomycetota bacterium]